MKRVRDDSNEVRRLAFLLWLLAFFVCLAFLGFIVYGYLNEVLAGFPKLQSSH